jgi:hypothetical protein
VLPTSVLKYFHFFKVPSHQILTVTRVNFALPIGNTNAPLKFRPENSIGISNSVSGGERGLFLNFISFRNFTVGRGNKGVKAIKGQMVWTRWSIDEVNSTVSVDTA